MLLAVHLDLRLALISHLIRLTNDCSIRINDTCMRCLQIPRDDCVWYKYSLVKEPLLICYQYKILPGATVNMSCHWWCCCYRTWVLMETQLAVCKMPSSNVLVHLTRRWCRSWTFCIPMVPRRVGHCCTRTCCSGLKQRGTKWCSNLILTKLV